MDLTKPSRRRTLPGLLLWAAATGGAGCGESIPTPPTGISEVARAYLDEVIGVMQHQSMHHLTIDWTAFRTTVFASGGAAQSVSETVPANPAVAVLVDNGVASSGEATFIAFRRRANTRSFGVATCGLSTANRGFVLSDGALLTLTVSVMADRARRCMGIASTPTRPSGHNQPSSTGQSRGSRR